MYLTLRGEHTREYTDHVSWACALETYMILVTNVPPNRFNKKKMTQGSLLGLLLEDVEMSLCFRRGEVLAIVSL